MSAILSLGAATRSSRSVIAAQPHDKNRIKNKNFFMAFASFQ
jgi:hypothetical protein